MINLFVNPDDEIVINFAVASDKEGKIYADVNKVDLEEMLKDVDCKVEEYTVIFKRPSFGDAVDMVGEIYQTNSQGGININPLADKYQKLVKLVKTEPLILLAKMLLLHGTETKK